MKRTGINRFLRKCVLSKKKSHSFLGSQCWIWTGAKTTGGYGLFKYPNKPKTIGAHRFSYEKFVGPIPDGLQIDHLCRNPSCVNPCHLEPVTTKENTRRAKEYRDQHPDLSYIDWYVSKYNVPREILDDTGEF